MAWRRTSSWVGVLAIGCVGLLGVSASALPLDSFPPTDHNDAGPDLFDAYNAIVGTALTSNADLTGFFTGGEEETFSAQDFNVAVLIGTSAAYSNTVGFYPVGDPATQTTLFQNVTGFDLLGPLYLAVAFQPTQDFGLYLESTTLSTGVNTWHSESSLDAGSTAFDHMISYLLPSLVTLETDAGSLVIQNGLLIGWEDLPLKADGDYDDLMLVIGFVPEPSVLLLGLVGLAGLLRAGSRGRAAR